MWTRSQGRNPRNINLCFFHTLVNCLDTRKQSHIFYVFLLFWLSHWILSKEQKGGSGGLLCDSGRLPAKTSSKTGLFSLLPAELEKFTQNILPLSLHLGRTGLSFEALWFQNCSTLQRFLNSTSFSSGFHQTRWFLLLWKGASYHHFSAEHL